MASNPKWGHIRKFDAKNPWVKKSRDTDPFKNATYHLDVSAEVARAQCITVVSAHRALVIILTPARVKVQRVARAARHVSETKVHPLKRQRHTRAHSSLSSQWHKREH
jgi:hypothetical protein